MEAFQAYSLNILWTCTKQIHKTANIFHHQYFTLLQNISGYYFISAKQSKYNSYHHIESYWHVHLSTSYYRFMVPLINTSPSSYRFECFRIFQDISLHPKSLQSKSKTTPSPVRRRSSFDVDVAVAAAGASAWWWWTGWKNWDLTSKNGTFKIYRWFVMAKLVYFTSLRMIYGYIELCHGVCKPTYN